MQQSAAQAQSTPLSGPKAAGSGASFGERSECPSRDAAERPNRDAAERGAAAKHFTSRPKAAGTASSFSERSERPNRDATERGAAANTPLPGRQPQEALPRSVSAPSAPIESSERGAAAKHSPYRQNAAGSAASFGERPERSHKDATQRGAASDRPVSDARKTPAARRADSFQPASAEERPAEGSHPAGKGARPAFVPRWAQPKSFFGQKPAPTTQEAATKSRPARKDTDGARPHTASVERDGKKADFRSGKPAHASQRAERSDTPARREGTSARSYAATPGRHTDDRPTLRSGQTLELTINAMNDDGFGVAQHEGTRVLVAHGMPGEQVVVRVTYVGRREAFGNIIKCLKSSSDRVAVSLCGMGRLCDGCSLMQMRYPAQLAWKKGLVGRQLRNYPSLSDVVSRHHPLSPGVRLPQLGKARGVREECEPGDRHVQAQQPRRAGNLNCPLHLPLINKVVQAAKVGIRKGKVPITTRRARWDSCATWWSASPNPATGSWWSW